MPCLLLRGLAIPQSPSHSRWLGEDEHTRPDLRGHRCGLVGDPGHGDQPVRRKAVLGKAISVVWFIPARRRRLREVFNTVAFLASSVVYASEKAKSEAFVALKLASTRQRRSPDRLITFDTSGMSRGSDWCTTHLPSRRLLELDDGTQLAESVAICRYIEELHPEPPLFGTTPIERALIEMWNRRMCCGLAHPLT